MQSSVARNITEPFTAIRLSTTSGGSTAQLVGVNTRGKAKSANIRLAKDPEARIKFKKITLTDDCNSSMEELRVIECSISKFPLHEIII
jgi:hypothetical protein